MEIRRFRDEDAGEVHDLIADCLVNVNSRYYGEEIINNLMDQYSEEHLIGCSRKRIMLVALGEKRILGTGSFGKDVITTLFVTPRLHRKGLGSALVKELEGTAKAQGHSFVRVFSSMNAVGFYREIGYSPVRRVASDTFGENIEMTKAL